MMNLFRAFFFLFAAIICTVWILFFPHVCQAEELTGEGIARQVFDRDRGQNSRASAAMVLIDKSGYKRSRIFTNIRIVENALEKQLIRFTSPKDIAGTGFLTIEKPGYETDQFLYLSALRRTRRIVSSQKNHRFVQSDFLYEDMERHPVENYTYNRQKDQTIQNIACYVLETRPAPSIKSEYSLTVSWITKEGFVPIIAQYYDQKGNLFKTYTVLKLEKIQGIWTESIVKMEDTKRNHQTLIKIQQIEYNTNITSDQVSAAALEAF